MKENFKKFAKKAHLKTCFSRILIGILIFQMSIPYGFTAYAADSGTTAATLTESAIYVNGASGNDSNAGTTAETAFATIAMAMTAIQSGQTLYIASGNYNEPMVLSGKSNITIVGEKDTIVSGSTHAVWTSYGNDYPGVLNIDKSSSIDISNIHFVFAEDTENVGYDSTAFVVDSTDVKIHNCIIEAGDSVSACVQTNSNSTSTYILDSNIIKGGSSRGIWIPWGIEKEECQITNNIIENAVSIDVTPYDSTYKYPYAILIANNTCLGKYEAAGLPDDKNIVANNIFAGMSRSASNSGINTNNFVYTDISEVNFVDATTGDYHITAESPCNDAGTQQYETSKDFSGATRIGAKADIGAFQYGDVYYAGPYVSSGDGSKDAPFPLSEALGKLQPGDTLYLMGGWYYGMYDFSKYSNLCGSENAYIYITNYSSESVFIYGDSESNHALNVGAANQYIDLSGCNLQFDNDVAYRAGYIVTLDGVSHFNIHDCYISGGACSLSISGASSDITVYNNTFADSKRDIYLHGTISKINIYNNLFKQGMEARIYTWDGSVTDSIINNNVFTGTAGYNNDGISFDGYIGTVFTNNIIVNNIFATTADALPISILDATNNNTVDYNYFNEIPSGAGEHNVTGNLYCDGSYHITNVESVLYNAGNDTYAPALDRDGNAREGISDIGMYEAVGLDIPEVIPDWGKTLTHPALLNSENIKTVTDDLTTLTNAEKSGKDEDAINLGASLEGVWSNVVKATEGYLNQDYFLDTRYSRFCLYYPYVLQPVSWASRSSMQVGDSTTLDSNAKRAVTGITQSTYYVNFDFKPISPATAKDYIVYSSTGESGKTDVILKMDANKLYISNGSATEFVPVKSTTGEELGLVDGTWYNIYITVNKTGVSSIIVHPRNTIGDYRAQFTTFGTDAISGLFVGCEGTTALGKAHYDNIRIYDTYVPVVDEGFRNLDNWEKSGTVLQSAEAAYPSSAGSYNWTSINGDLQTIIQNFAITYTVKKAIGDADASAYFVKTKQLMLSIAHWNRWGDPDEPEKGSLDIGYITTGMSYAYDLLYNDLTAEERAVIAKAIKTKGVDVLCDANTDPSEYGYYDGVSTAPNTMYVQNAALGMAALVIGDVYNTEKALAVARENLEDSYKHGVDDDGAWIEGFIYGDLAVVNALPFHDADYRITGHDTINNNYLTKVVDYVIYNQFPGGKYYSNVADSALYSYEYKKILEYFTKSKRNKYAAWALTQLGSLPLSMDLLSLVWFPSGATVVEPTEDTVALGKVFNDMGVADLKTGWGDNDTLVTLKSSKIVANMQHHTHLDQNSIELIKGTSYLLCDPGYQAWSGPSRDFNFGSLGHNTLILDGSSQNDFGTSNDWTEIFGGQIESFFVGDKYGYSVGSAGNAYFDLNNEVKTIPEWRRSIVDLIGSDCYVLFDDYQTNADNKNLVWQLHSKGEWSASSSNENTMTVTIGDDQLSVIFLNTDFSKVKVDNAYGVPFGYSDTHRIYTTLDNGKENQNLLALLYPSAKGAALPQTTYMEDVDDTGVVVKSGATTDVVLFHKDSAEPIVLSGATHSTGLGTLSVDNTRVNKVVIKYTADKDVNLLQNGIVIGTLVGDGTERVDSFVLNSTGSKRVILSASGKVKVSDVWTAATTKTDATTVKKDTLTLPNPDSYYDLTISYKDAQNAVVSQDGVVIGELADGSGTSTIQLQKPYAESMVDGVRTATINISILGSIKNYSIKVAENETRHRIGKILDVGDSNDYEYSCYNTPGMVVSGTAWSGVLTDGSLTYRSGNADAQMYVNAANTRNSYTAYIKYRATTNVPVYQYKSDTKKTQIAELESSSTWRVASFDVKEYNYSPLTVSKDLVLHMLLEFGDAIEVESSWIELRDSDNQVDYTDVGKAGDDSNVKHTPGLVIGENFAAADADARISESNGTIYANITDTSKAYYVNIQYKSTANGKINQLINANGTTAEMAQYAKTENAYNIRFKLNGNYYDSNPLLRGTNILLSMDTDITILDMWLEEEIRTIYDTDLNEVDCTGSGNGVAFEPVKYTAYQPDTSINVDGVISEDEKWDLNMNLAYGVSDDSDFAAKAGVKWDMNYCYIVADITDAVNYDAGDVGTDDGILNGDGLEVYIAKTRGLKQYDANTAQYVFSTINGIFVGGGNGRVDKTKVVTNGINYAIKRNETGYVMEIAIPWQAIGGMTVQAGDKLGFTLHAFDKDTAAVPQNTIGLTEQYLMGDWYIPFYWPELTLVNQNVVAAESIALSATTKTMNFAETFDLKALVEPINATQPISYESSDVNIAKVDKWGIVTALSAGTATITAKAGSITAQCVVTVNAPTSASTISIKKTTYALGETVDVFYTGSKNPMWIGIYQSSVTVPNTSYLGWSYASSTVNSGCVSLLPADEDTPVATGAFKVILFTDAGYTPVTGQEIAFTVIDPVAITGVTIDKTDLTLGVGDKNALTASVNTDTTYDQHIVWYSSNPKVAAVDQNGRILATGTGTAVITAAAYADSSKKVTCTVTVK